MASLRERGGHFYVRGRNRHGRQVEEPLPARNKTEARRMVVEWGLREDKIRRGYDVDQELLTLEQLWGKYEPVAKNKGSYTDIEARFRNHILPALGKKLVQHIRPIDIDLLLSKKKEEGYSPQTREHLRVNLSAIFSFAVKNKYLRENVASLVDKVHIPEPEPKVLEPWQVEKIIEAATTEEAKLLIRMAAFTAMRKGELLGLRWSDIDLDARFIRVTRSYDGETKSRKHRTVPFPASLVPHLREAAESSDNEYLFPDSSGNVRTRKSAFHICKRFKTALVGAGLISGYMMKCRRKGCGHKQMSGSPDSFPCPHCNYSLLAVPVPIPVAFKDLRSTCITHLVDATGGLRAGQLLAGHGNERTTGRHYAKKRDKVLRDQVDSAFSSHPIPNP